jgi:hypothetical protein
LTRRSCLIVATVVLALVAGSLASARPTTTDARFRCGVKAIDIYFWPRGHAALSAYPFPAYRPAHVTIFKKGTTSKRGFLLFVSAGSRIVAPGCRSVRDKLATRWDGGPINVVKKARRIRCSFPTKVQLRAVPVVGGQRLVVVFGETSRTVLFAGIKPRGSVADYDSRYCRDAVIAGVR